MTAAKVQRNDQQTKRNGQAVMTTFNGQKKKMKNSTEFQQYKTILAPNAPWPYQPLQAKEPKPVKPPKTNENKCKIAVTHRKRDKLSGRLLPNDWVA